MWVIYTDEMEKMMKIMIITIRMMIISGPRDKDGQSLISMTQ